MCRQNLQEAGANDWTIALCIGDMRQHAAEYVALLQQADLVISTADHEFFGISILEAVAARAFPAFARPPELSRIDSGCAACRVPLCQ